MMGGGSSENNRKKEKTREREKETRKKNRNQSIRGKHLQRGVGGAERGRSDRDAAAVETLHRNAKALAELAEQIRRRHAHIIKLGGNEGYRVGRETNASNLHDVRWLGVPAEFALLLTKRQTLGARWHDDARNAAGARGASATHDKIAADRRR